MALRPIDQWALENVPLMSEDIVLPSTSVKGRIGAAGKPKASIRTWIDFHDFYSLLHITPEKDEDGDAVRIDVDVRGLIDAEDKEHGSPIPAGVILRGIVSGVDHTLTGRYENPAEAGWTIRFDCEAVLSFWCAVDLAVEPLKMNVHKDKLLGVKRLFDDFQEKLLDMQRSIDEVGA